METREEKIERLEQQHQIVKMSLANALNKVKKGGVVSATTIDELMTANKDLAKQLEQLKVNPDAAPPASPQSRSPQGERDTPSGEPEEEEDGLPERFRVKRKYNLSAAALEARRKNSQARRPGSEGNKRNWKGGLFARDFIEGRIKPCLSTCPIFDECELVSEGVTKAGGACMDKTAVIQTYSALMDAIKHKDYDEFNSVSALMISETMHVYRRMLEDIMREGPYVKREKYDKNGDLQVIEYVPHPNMMALPKLFADIGLTPNTMMATPKAIKDDKNAEEANKTAAGLMSDFARRARDQSGKKEQGEGDE